MSSIRESSQQDRRVYVGNLSYDVKWHSLKDFMRKGELCLSSFLTRTSRDADPTIQLARSFLRTYSYFRTE